MDTLSFTKVKSLFILTLIQRDDGQKKQTLKTTNFEDANKWRVCLRLA